MLKSKFKSWTSKNLETRVSRPSLTCRPQINRTPVISDIGLNVFGCGIFASRMVSGRYGTRLIDLTARKGKTESIAEKRVAKAHRTDPRRRRGFGQMQMRAGG